MEPLKLQDSVSNTAMLAAVGIFRESRVDQSGFLPVCTLTVLEGLILFILLHTISFFCLVFLQARERRRFLRSIADRGSR